MASRGCRPARRLPATRAAWGIWRRCWGWAGDREEVRRPARPASPRTGANPEQDRDERLEDEPQPAGARQAPRQVFEELPGKQVDAASLPRVAQGARRRRNQHGERADRRHPREPATARVDFLHGPQSGAYRAGPRYSVARQAPRADSRHCTASVISRAATWGAATPAARLGEGRSRGIMPGMGDIATLGPCRFRLAGVPNVVSDEERIPESIRLLPGGRRARAHLFELAGPRERLFFDPAGRVPAIVTCGGLCPGLNNVDPLPVPRAAPWLRRAGGARVPLRLPGPGPGRGPSRSC